jgi:hypothetical protein
MAQFFPVDVQYGWDVFSSPPLLDQWVSGTIFQQMSNSVQQSFSK